MASDLMVLNRFGSIYSVLVVSEQRFTEVNPGSTFDKSGSSELAAVCGELQPAGQPSETSLDVRLLCAPCRWRAFPGSSTEQRLDVMFDPAWIRLRTRTRFGSDSPSTPMREKNGMQTKAHPSRTLSDSANSRMLARPFPQFSSATRQAEGQPTWSPSDAGCVGVSPHVGVPRASQATACCCCERDQHHGSSHYCYNLEKAQLKNKLQIGLRDRPGVTWLDVACLTGNAQKAQCGPPYIYITPVMYVSHTTLHLQSSKAVFRESVELFLKPPKKRALFRRGIQTPIQTPPRRRRLVIARFVDRIAEATARPTDRLTD